MTFPKYAEEVEAAQAAAAESAKSPPGGAPDLRPGQVIAPPIWANLDITERLHRAALEVATVAKTAAVEAGGGKSYKAITHDEVVHQCRPALLKWGIVVLFSVAEAIEERVEVERRGGDKRTEWRVRMRVDCTFVAAGDLKNSVTISQYAIGVDSSDKHYGKAASYAKKYALAQTLLLYTGEQDELDLKGSPDDGVRGSTQAERIAAEKAAVAECEAAKEAVKTAFRAITDMLGIKQSDPAGDWLADCFKAGQDTSTVERARETLSLWKKAQSVLASLVNMVGVKDVLAMIPQIRRDARPQTKLVDSLTLLLGKMKELENPAASVAGKDKADKAEELSDEDQELNAKITSAFHSIVSALSLRQGESTPGHAWAQACWDELRKGSLQRSERLELWVDLRSAIEAALQTMSIQSVLDTLVHEHTNTSLTSDLLVRISTDALWTIAGVGEPNASPDVDPDEPPF